MSKTILVVDDDEYIIKSLDLLLSDAGYKVFPAESGKEALKILDEHQIDLIITDIIMPDMEGIEFINIVKRQKKLPVKIIAMSGVSQRSTYLKMALTMGADATLIKPFTVSQVLEAVQQVLN